MFFRTIRDSKDLLKRINETHQSSVAQNRRIKKNRDRWPDNNAGYQIWLAQCELSDLMIRMTAGDVERAQKHLKAVRRSALSFLLAALLLIANLIGLFAVVFHWP